MAGIVTPMRDILARLGTIQVLNQTGVEVPMSARVFNDQTKKMIEGEIEYIPVPATFLEIVNPVNYSEIGGGYVAADIVMRLHLLHEFYDAQDGNFEQDLVIFGLRDQLIRKMTHFKPTGCGLLTRTGEEQSYLHGNMYEYIVEFTCHFIDSIGSDDDRLGYIYKEPPTELELHITIANGNSHVIPVDPTEPPAPGNGVLPLTIPFIVAASPMPDNGVLPLTIPFIVAASPISGNNILPLNIPFTI